MLIYQERKRASQRATSWLNGLQWETEVNGISDGESPGPLHSFFDQRVVGPGIWKWHHYFDIYERHLAKFRNKEVGILEIGIYSGGSLDMWRTYFGEQCHLYGVDLMPECKMYERKGVSVFIGDQADRTFWQAFKQDVPWLDVVIDDGGHMANQQIVTFEELLPHLRPGGMYICEDIHGDKNAFANYIHRVAEELNAYSNVTEDLDNPQRRAVCKTNAFQSEVAAIHFYPYMVVVERSLAPIDELLSVKHGTEWQPFLS